MNANNNPNGASEMRNPSKIHTEIEHANEAMQSQQKRGDRSGAIRTKAKIKRLTVELHASETNLEAS